MEDLRLIKVEEREGYAFIVAGILAMVVGGAMLLAGIFAQSKVAAAIPTTSFSAAENTTYAETKQNILDALSIGGVVIIFIGIGLLIAGVRALGQ